MVQDPLPEDRLVLIVDDDPDLLQTLRFCPRTKGDPGRMEGYRVLMAENGEEALEVLKSERPDVILLDLMMPVMDGWQFVAEMDARGQRGAPLLILSADRAVQGHAGNLKASGHLAKPFDLDELLTKVQQSARGCPTDLSS